MAAAVPAAVARGYGPSTVAGERHRPHERARIRVVGGGVAGIEAVLALADMAPGLAELSLIAPEPDFLYKPLLVEEPFTGEPAGQFSLEPLLAGVGAALIGGTLERVDPDRHRITLEDGSELEYEFLVVCVGGRPRPAYEEAETFWAGSSDLDVDSIVARAEASPGRVLHLVVPPGTSWPLPLYELALMFRRRATERGADDLRIEVLTPEQGPLMIFGRAASDAVAELLEARRIDVRPETSIFGEEAAPSVPGGVGERLPTAAPTVALPMIEGPSLAGLPADPHGFIPIDADCKVLGMEDVYAAGDGTTFPVKQGGLATQQADAAAEHIAAQLGAEVEPRGFTPVLRGTLLTGMESLHLRHRISGGGGEGVASAEQLWWPPDKISGRYLSAALSGFVSRSDVDPALQPLEVEVAWPREWHSQPFTPSVHPQT